MRNGPYILFALLTLATGCDQVDQPIPPGGGGGGNGGGSTVTRNVLLEEFTGHRCSTCPAAHLVAKQLVDLYGDRMVVVGIHATSTFAAPVNPPNANGSYSTDFRTPAGDTYTTAFGVSFLPTGVVSRKPFNSSLTLSQGTWGSAISALIDQPALFDLWVEDLVHNAANNTVSATVKVALLRPVETDHKLTVYLLEDRVVDWQLNGQASPPDVPDYEHRHVLRRTLTDTWGLPAVAGGSMPGDTLSFSFNGIPMDPSWNPSECSLVAFLHEGVSNEVMQVMERRFTR
jgi:hypothetical protein